MKICCFRVFACEELWDCLFIVKRSQDYVLYTSVDQLPLRESVELRALQLMVPNDSQPMDMDSNCLECVIKSLESSIDLRRSLMRKMSIITSMDNNNITVSVQDINLIEPQKYRLQYTWCEMYEKTNLEYRELEDIMAWLSTLGGAFSSLGDKTEQCAIVAGKISLQQLQIAIKIGDPLIAARCQLYVAISLMQRGQFKTARRIIKKQYLFVKSHLVVDERLVKMCCGIWTKLRYEQNKTV
ncbi:uncharacterized protein LOC126847154 [Adelges cooleyi]|uniref:uncharacterized protein LOC126847154 n=1 Tax=Adelges cooleyi TaxID=133065 RepID=UPI00217F369E|nr:uncharacterized protein LOC126847154 [Adelges cooleyi]